MNEEKEKILSYLYTLKMKLKSFQSRAPVYFSFQNDLSNLYIQEIDSMEILEFPIDYSVSVTDFISEVREELRTRLYPKMEQVSVFEIEPSIEEINREIHETEDSFDVVYNRLKVKETINRYIIDKIDTINNRIIVIDEKDREKIFIYKVKMPVVVFVKKYIRSGLSERELYEVFQKHSTYIER